MKKKIAKKNYTSPAKSLRWPEQRGKKRNQRDCSLTERKTTRRKPFKTLCGQMIEARESLAIKVHTPKWGERRQTPRS